MRNIYPLNQNKRIFIKLSILIKFHTYLAKVSTYVLSDYFILELSVLNNKIDSGANSLGTTNL